MDNVGVKTFLKGEDILTTLSFESERDYDAFCKALVEKSNAIHIEQEQLAVELSVIADYLQVAKENSYWSEISMLGKYCVNLPSSVLDILLRIIISGFVSIS